MAIKLGRERGWQPAGSDRPDPSQHGIFRHGRYSARFEAVPQGQIMRAIRRLGTQVAPIVRAEIARRTTV